MNTLELMDSCTSSYSKTDRRIYELIRKFPDAYATKSVTQLSQEARVSKPALTRFAQRLGFSGFVEFQYQLARDLEDVRTRTDAPSNAKVYGRLLRAVDEQLDHALLRALGERIKHSSHVYLMGYNLSRIPAEELNIALKFQPEVASSLPQVDVFPRFRDNDVLIIFSAMTGSSFKPFFTELKTGRYGRPYLVLVTTNTKHPLRREFDEVFALPTATLATASNAVLGDTFAFLMFNDTLTQVLADDEDAGAAQGSQD